jgi:A/G-specific adenine glycosylase
LNYAAIRKKLTQWYEANQRDLPWRRTRDPYAIWISEIMLQQTRVAAVIPYWERFLERFPDVQALAAAPEDDVLTSWSGLGYYSRARNLQAAARQIVQQGAFPNTYQGLLQLKGVGEYTAAAVASIAFHQNFSVVDGNVRRVVARLRNEQTPDVQHEADLLLDRSHPGRFNQALMELGALVCLPKAPACPACPVRMLCAAHKAGTQQDVPAKKERPVIRRLHIRLLMIRRGENVLLIRSTRVQGFLELPEPDSQGMGRFQVGCKLGVFRHAILDRLYTFEVFEASLGEALPQNSDGFVWCPWNKLNEIPLSTAARKALFGLVNKERGDLLKL